MRSAYRDKLNGILFLLFSPAAFLLLMECFLRNPFNEKWGMKPAMIIINLLFFYILESFLLGVTGSLRVALYIEWCFALLFGLIDYYVYSFRGNTIVPWDLFSMKTAFSVADNYSYIPERSAVIVILLFLALGLLLTYCRLTIRKNLKLRLTLSLVSLLFLIFIYAPFVQSENTVKRFKIYDKLFTPSTMSMRDGMVYAFIYDMKFLKVEKPSGYDENEVKRVLSEEYGSEGGSIKKTPVSEDTPNIIVIMCEAFSDPRVLSGFKTNKDYMPFIRSLINSPATISGDLHVSVLGGNTPNTEFEFLTGNTMGFLPEGSIPFQQFINSEVNALPRDLGKLGYNTLAMHPYFADGWDRDRVYPLLGFEKMRFLNYFKERDPKLIRKYVSDEALFNEIIEAYKENGKTTPLFSFNVTMQNHSEYSGELLGFKPEIRLEGSDGDSLLERYLSLEKVTDNAFKDLISYFDSIEDPTVIVFFGDHQPNDYVVEPVWNMNGISGKDLTDEERRRRYEVPFLIWANYSLEGSQGLEISANYLGNLVLEAAGLELCGYRAFLNDEMKSCPVISAVEETDSSGASKDMDKDDPALSLYRSMQYYNMSSPAS